VSFDSNPLSADPRLANATGADFHLQASSPAIDSGSNAVATLVGDDYDGVVARPVNAGFDIGAYEYLAGYAYDRIFADGFQ
jgi:hypothetical protein